MWLWQYTIVKYYTKEFDYSIIIYDLKLGLFFYPLSPSPSMDGHLFVVAILNSNGSGVHPVGDYKNIIYT